MPIPLLMFDYQLVMNMKLRKGVFYKSGHWGLSEAF